MKNKIVGDNIADFPALLKGKKIKHIELTTNENGREIQGVELTLKNGSRVSFSQGLYSGMAVHATLPRTQYGVVFAEEGTIHPATEWFDTETDRKKFIDDILTKDDGSGLMMSQLSMNS